MNFLLLSIFIVTFCSQIVLIICENSEGIVSVNTKNGKVIGQRKVVFGKTYNEFLSIPYAKPPIGNLRFKRPKPVNNWTNPINATQLPNPCYQIPLTDTFLNKNFSEDCLYLIIWQPITETDHNKLKAVLFFIHAGGLIVGSSSEYQFQGQILSTKGDVVLVTHNYRVGTFGFFYTGLNDTTGNAGLFDNVMALKWVRNNIRSFGGNPDNITIVGHSGGSWALSVHILSPISRNLFKQAILMSGALISDTIATKRYSYQMWLNASKLIGCANQTDISFLNHKILNCLRSVNASSLAGIIFAPEILKNIVGMPPMVVIDGVFLPKSPVEMFDSGDYKKNLNLMIGTVEDESNVAMALFVRGYGLISADNFTYNQSIANLIEVLTRVPSYATIDGKQVAKLYFDEISPENIDYDFLRLTTNIAVGDYYLGCQTKVFAESVFNNDQQNSNVYEYYYKSKLGNSVYLCAEWMGACHGSDLSPLFGLPFIYYDNYTDAQRIESEQVIGFYSHFAKFGYPSPQYGIDWTKYYSLNGNIVTPYLHIDTNRSYFDYGLKITECQYLWKKYFYVKVPNV